MSRVYIKYIRYICIWNQTDSKSYISVIGYSRGTKLCITRYMIHRTVIVTVVLQTELQTEETCQIRMSTFIVSGIVLKIQ